MNKVDARDRLIAAACRVVAAERGGLDHANADAEQELALEIFDQAVTDYYEAREGRG